MKKRLQTDIYSLAFGGSGVGKVDGKVCFVEGALPGEKVIFDAEKDTSRYIQGRAVEILTPSGDRVEPVCRYYGKCGGCQLQHISYEKELFYKREQITELVRRIAGKKDFTSPEMIPSPEPYNYRTSLTLHVTDDGYGFYSIDGNTRLRIEECPIASEPINAELGGLSPEIGKDRITLKSDCRGKVWASHRQGERFFPDRFRDTEIMLSPKTFSQCNRYIAEKIAETLEEWIGPADPSTTFFDAYCGVGFFGFMLRQDFGMRVGIDMDRIAIDCAKTTVKRTSLDNVKFYRADAEKDFFEIFDRLRSNRNIILLDPPRRGASGGFLNRLKKNGYVSGIYYISCDPARLARDIKIITEDSPWELGRVTPFDMFPRTKHIEALVEFVRG
jgi:tRNA/tmRNA/rRNA uracil-C5-methylase (TrmA/RlmC/RlmD family)